MKGCKLNPLALGLALGVLWGASTLILGLLDYHFAYGDSFVSAVGSLYPGYAPSIKGSFVGGFIGFMNGLATGLLIGWLYNCFCCCKCICCAKKKEEETK